MRGAAASALAVEGIRVDLRGKPVLRGLDLSVAEGECRAVVGLNGAGKTTTLRVILGMLRPEAGRVLLHGRDITSSPQGHMAAGRPPGGDTAVLPRAHRTAEHRGIRPPARSRSRARREGRVADE
ncbi:ATP-binding cassette domain-containing protein [Actinomyces massiliensis]|uniref:ATP-binding cassette domain-containing protein n=1 Tax=Actinomyces massiliensis TaxID=461393 RepID=UPI00237863E1|nr:ATP-binding cassette domain-containing protein [Actinomyces massiliensis]